MADDDWRDPPETTPGGFPRLSFGEPDPEAPEPEPQEEQPRPAEPGPAQTTPAGDEENPEIREIPDPPLHRSPMQALAELQDPGIYDAPDPGNDDSDGHLPATFTAAPASEGPGAGPQLGALAMGTALAVSAAALRGLQREDKSRNTAAGAAGAGTGTGRGTPGTGHGAGGPGGGSGPGRGRGGGGGRGPSRGAPGTGSGSPGTGRGGAGTTPGGSGTRRGPVHTTNQSAGLAPRPPGAGGHRPGPGPGPFRNHPDRTWNSSPSSRNGPGSPRNNNGRNRNDGRNQGRTTLAQALGNDTADRAAPRLDHRRQNLTPALAGASGTTTREKKPRLDKLARTRTTLAQALKKDTSDRAEERWAKRNPGSNPIFSRARRNAASADKSAAGPASDRPGPPRPALGPGPDSHQRKEEHKHNRRVRDRARRAWDEARRRAAGRARSHGTRHDHGDHDPYEGAGFRDFASGRRSPWGSAGMAAAGPPTVTLHRDGPSRPRGRRATAGAVTTGQRALDPAPTPHHPRPGTTRPAPEPEPAADTPASSTTAGGDVSPPPVTGAPGGTPAASLVKTPSTGTAIAAQHDTEITLDDVLEVLEVLTGDGFDAYDKCAALALEAAQVRTALDHLADDLRERHNVSGNITAAAMELLAESMDVLVEKSYLMQFRALSAAEHAELADQQMHDAYKPVQQATADAGLATPSARVHNES